MNGPTTRSSTTATRTQKATRTTKAAAKPEQLSQALQAVLDAPCDPAAVFARISTRDLLAVCQDVTLGVTRRSSLPILEQVLVTQTADLLALGATNLAWSVTRFVPLTNPHPTSAEQPIQALLPARQFADFVRAADGAETVIVGSRDGSRETLTTRVFSGRSATTLRGCDPEDFPAIPSAPFVVTRASPAASEAPESPQALTATVTAEALIRAIAQTVYTTATDDARPVFCSVNFRFDAATLETAGADSFRVSVQQVPLIAPLAPTTDAFAALLGDAVPHPFNVLIDNKALGVLVKLLGRVAPETPVHFTLTMRQLHTHERADTRPGYRIDHAHTFGPNHDWTIAAVVVSAADVFIFTTITIQGVFPAYEAFMLDPTTARVRASFQRDALRRALTRVKLVATDAAGVVRFRVDEASHTLTLTATTDDSDCSEEIDLVSDPETRFGHDDTVVFQLDANAAPTFQNPGLARERGERWMEVIFNYAYLLDAMNHCDVGSVVRFATDSRTGPACLMQVERVAPVTDDAADAADAAEGRTEARVADAQRFPSTSFTLMPLHNTR